MFKHVIIILIIYIPANRLNHIKYKINSHLQILQLLQQVQQSKHTKLQINCSQVVHKQNTSQTCGTVLGHGIHGTGLLLWSGGLTPITEELLGLVQWVFVGDWAFVF